MKSIHILLCFFLFLFTQESYGLSIKSCSESGQFQFDQYELDRNQEWLTNEMDLFNYMSSQTGTFLQIREGHQHVICFMLLTNDQFISGTDFLPTDTTAPVSPITIPKAKNNCDLIDDFIDRTICNLSSQRTIILNKLNDDKSPLTPEDQNRLKQEVDRLDRTIAAWKAVPETDRNKLQQSPKSKKLTRYP